MTYLGLDLGSCFLKFIKKLLLVNLSVSVESNDQAEATKTKRLIKFGGFPFNVCYIIKRLAIRSRYKALLNIQ